MNTETTIGNLTWSKQEGLLDEKANKQPMALWAYTSQSHDFNRRGERGLQFSVRRSSGYHQI